MPKLNHGVSVSLRYFMALLNLMTPSSFQQGEGDCHCHAGQLVIQETRDALADWRRCGDPCHGSSMTCMWTVVSSVQFPACICMRTPSPPVPFCE
ncbi:hypothetical protein SORBI_3003G434100 [Sorghum bicolor]|uniref:Secreted protein n=1 Tax=Sorghum bicolor TaxID=4558 RepID=A0A1B6Q8B6_SORBI|nr:hypothetical protein SORBI_3003G434100 [Sorghum bicolor]